MAAKIDMDALKIFKKSRTSEAENRQKIKQSVSTQDSLVWKKSVPVLWFVYFWKILKPKVTVNI